VIIGNFGGHPVWKNPGGSLYGKSVKKSNARYERLAGRDP
jgi:hypothetical protein